MISNVLARILGVRATTGRGVMMKARHTLVLSIIAGSVGAAEIQSFRGQAKPKIHRVVMIIVAALGAMLSAARAETPVERGGYLVNAVMACDGCHTPRPPGGAFDMSKRFSGGSQKIGRASCRERVER